ncbi:MAG TPA: hypothetical protein VGO80_13545 [Solirubrobacteraceae bacterium]|jgi:hypothetical protein|nr:hypothetical protein [Solirubrobacteraceae bacterium]
MRPPRDICADLEPGAGPDLVALAERLDRERPVPSASFRGDLRRRLVGAELTRSRPARLRLLIAGYASAGTVLLLLGAASAAGVGPLAA